MRRRFLKMCLHVFPPVCAVHFITLQRLLIEATCRRNSNHHSKYGRNVKYARREGARVRGQGRPGEEAHPTENEPTVANGAKNTYYITDTISKF